MKLELLTSVWGEKHIELFKNLSIKSLSFKHNKKSLYEKKARWNIFTDKKYFLYLEKILFTYLPELEINLKSLEDLRTYCDITQSATVWQIEECLKNNTRLLLVPPDTIFGDETVSNLLELTNEPDSVAVVPHIRVNPSIIPHLTDPLSSRELVSLGFKHLHRSWEDAEMGHPRQNSFVGGVRWQKLKNDTYEVVHYLPTPYMMNFIREDLDYFKVTNCAGSFDHLWPGEVLIKQNPVSKEIISSRQRYVNDSDFAFMAEVTANEKNIPPVYPGDLNGFWKNHLHNEVNQHIRSIFKGVDYAEEKNDRL